ncbi:MAG: transcriptional regulator, BadM/Rrf2 family [Candidatus Aminicenantes bacterium]|nr:transcriptional regulator, BadM/Rrf2 family [Candidatus Aminicenantes bacterium]
MIRVSTKGRYGTRLMLNLARHFNSGNKAVILRNIAEEEQISIRYLEQIIIALKIYKLVKSIRGAGGGYTLARKPSEITVCQILEALEGSCGLVDCVEDNTFCDRLPSCAAYEVWKEASHILKDYFQRVTLQYVLDICEKKPKPRTKSRR